jgi:hypothetical protein
MIFATLAIALPAIALGDEIHMAWNACELEGGTNVEKFACDTDAGNHVIVTSFTLNQAFSGFLALDATVTVGTLGTNSTLPDWWRTAPGYCREGAIGVSLDFLDSPQTACFDPWFGQGYTTPVVMDVITTPDLPPHGSSTYGRIRFSGYILTGATDLSADTEYLAFKLRVSNTGTTGPGACDECCDPAALYVQELRLASESDIRPLYQQNYPIQWQTPTGCRPVPALAKTWGQVRGMYR